VIARVLRVVAAGLLLGATDAWAQHEQHTPDPAGTTWAWRGAAQVFLNVNLQERRFTDFHQAESQNWFMGTGARRVGSGVLSLVGMLSLEPFSLRDLGSAQVFQTGETYEGAPLIDYQHPHDLLMQLSASYRRALDTHYRLRLTAAVVGEPALGPTVFMHRASALPNPTVPLTHHQLDSTHITPGVFTAALDAPAWSVEASAFRGREPDEDRLDVDLGAIDSWSVRGVGRRGGWLAQASGGRLHDPDAIEPGDVTRLTASVEYVGAPAGRDTAFTLAWGVNRDRFGSEAGWLLEGTLALTDAGTVYVRGEIADKHVLDAGGAHPPGFAHPHVLSRVGAWTTGYEHRLSQGRFGRFAVGGDLTLHYTPDNLSESYGHPVSIHLFIRWSAGELARQLSRVR
jgi:hypothetical protein